MTKSTKVQIEGKMDWSRVFFTADTHFGHGNILKYCNRPFLNEQEQKLLAGAVIAKQRGESHPGLDRPGFKVSRESIELNDNTIINNINSVVGRDDVLWHLGDFAFADYRGARNYRDRIVCQNVYLIWGNHDKPYIRDLFTECYKTCLQQFDDKQVMMDHYPDDLVTQTDKNILYLHGHVHAGIRRTPAFFPAYDNLPICDVGVDGLDKTKSGGNWDHKFMPWSLKDLCEFAFQKASYDNNESLQQG